MKQAEKAMECFDAVPEEDPDEETPLFGKAWLWSCWAGRTRRWNLQDCAGGQPNAEEPLANTVHIGDAKKRRQLVRESARSCWPCGVFAGGAERNWPGAPFSSKGVRGGLESTAPSSWNSRRSTCERWYNLGVPTRR